MGGHIPEIALIGMAGRFPGARDTAKLWRNLRDGVDSVRRLTEPELARLGVAPALRADPAYVPVTAQMADLDGFDAQFFGFDSREAEILDPQHRVFLELAWEALESAGYDPAAEPRPVGVFAGATPSTYLLFNVMADAARRGASDPLPGLIANSGDSLAARVSYKLNLRGPSFTVQSGCSTSLVAAHLACASLLNGECDLALAGAVSINVHLLAGYLARSGGLLSKEGRCRAFDAGASGILFGHGGGVVVLKRLADALADGDTVRAVVPGSAVNNDGSFKVAFSAPSVEGQAEVLTEAWAAAGIEPEALSYIEAHGTGTRAGDAVEAQALVRAFDAHTSRRGFCALGAVKTNIGHLDAAAGICGLIKTVLALEHRQIPPSLHFAEPNPEIDFDSGPLRPVTELTDWPAPREGPRRAGVSSFGLGGTNAHMVVEEAPPAPPSPSRAWDLLILSARSAPALERATVALAGRFGDSPPPELSDAAFTLQLGRRRFAHRRALACRPGEDVAGLLRRCEPNRVLTLAEEAGDREVALLFPDLAEGYPGMGAGLYGDEPVFRREVDRCAELLAPQLGRDLRDTLLGSGTEARPAPPEGSSSQLSPLAEAGTFAIEYALACLWMSWGVRPAALLGSGSGEAVAACVEGRCEIAESLRWLAEPAAARPASPAPGLPELSRQPGDRILLAMGGPGCLADLAGRCARAAPGTGNPVLAALPPAGDQRPDSMVTLTALARLWLLGVCPDWAAFHAGELRRRVPLPTYPFEHQRYWLDAADVPRPLSALAEPDP